MLCDALWVPRRKKGNFVLRIKENVNYSSKKYIKNSYHILWVKSWLKHVIKVILIKSTHLVLEFKSNHESMRKHRNNKFGYGIEVFIFLKSLLFHIPSKLNVLYWIPLFLFPKDNHRKRKKSYVIFKWW